ncbi:DUF4259 domain-containing protein [Rhizohabitans arisaemae]|uniref:DUF4259 domain-containing protein n=1 Tax=Rhizohabitans arisaemae TaxID=2720610 RepID=UPI0024B124A1|nr:DUF4259 domain-containing protein [Rhizohabitans arisaemae]
MGTWGSGPFDNDTAEDFLDELEEMSPSQRQALVEKLFHSAIEGREGSRTSVLPEEVVAAAALVAANIPAGSSIFLNEDYPGIAEWLERPVLPALASLAIQAVEVTFSADSWFWGSWVDTESRKEAQSAIRSLRSVLAPDSKGEP